MRSFFFVGRIAPRFVRWTNRQKKKRLEGGRWRHFVISSSVFFCSSLFLFCSFSFLFVLFVSSSIYCALCAAPVCLPRPMGFSHSFSTLVVVVVLFYFILLFVMKIYGFGFMERNLLRDVDSLQPIVNDSMNQIELSHFSPCKKKKVKNGEKKCLEASLGWRSADVWGWGGEGGRERRRDASTSIRRRCPCAKRTPEGVCS